MKQQKNGISAGKRTPWWACVMLLCFVLSGCTRERTENDGREIPDDQAMVIMTVNTPKSTLPRAETRVQTDAEAHISAIKVLVFEQVGNNNVFLYSVSGTELVSASQQTQFKVMLATTTKPLKLILIANADSVFDDLTLLYGTPESEVREDLTISFTAAGLSGDLPMFGEVYVPEGIDASQVNNFTATVLRAIARVDIEKVLVADSPEFTLEEAYIYRANDLIQLIPDALVGGSTPKVNAPSVPEDAQFLATAIRKDVTDDPDSIIQLYLPESEAAQSDAQKVLGVTTVVIGGRFGGDGNPITYYRADFNSGFEGHPFGQVLRNHRYIFRIRKVNAVGWPTPGEAAENLSTSISIDVQTWEDFSSELYFDEDRFAVSARDISLRYVRYRERGIRVESTLNYSIQWLDNSGNPTGMSASAAGQTISNDHFDATIVRTAGDTENTSGIVFRTLNQNHLGGLITDKLRITVGKWFVDITVNQEYSAMYSNVYPNILTVEEVGNLGVNMVSNGASAVATRTILDTHFAPEGTIRIGGFSFTRIPNNDQYLNTTAAANLAVLNRIISSQDIIYLPNAVRISSQTADLMLRWLNESPYRVLMIGTDSDVTNINLLAKEPIAADATWLYNITTVSTNFLRAPAREGTEDFFEGPFGDVAAGAAFNRQDGTAGYSINFSDTVIPLITPDQAGATGYMVFGVNKSNRVIYNGDAQLLMTPQMSNNNGNVTSDLDKLISNVWAWMVEQVIYGDE